MSSINYSTVNGINSVYDLTCISTPELLYKLVMIIKDFDDRLTKNEDDIADEIKLVQELIDRFFSPDGLRAEVNKVIAELEAKGELAIGINDEVVSKYLTWSSDKIQKLADKLDDVIESKLVVNAVVDYGAVGDGITDNTEIIQKAINELQHGQALYFPNGTYKCGQISISSRMHIHRTVKIIGETSMYDGDSGNGDWIGGGTIIEFTGTDTDFIIPGSYNKPPTLILENIIFKGSSASDQSSFQRNQFLRPAYNSDSNNYFYVKADNCLFYGWRSVFGEYRDIDYGGSNDIAENYKLATVTATNCTFMKNKCGLTGLLDSVITNCRIVSNDYGIVLRKWMFANRIVNNRIEWNTLHGIYIYKGASIITNNEFDRSGYAGLYIVQSDNSVIADNKLLRNGAHETASLRDGIDNVHIYAKGNVQCVFNGNVTVRQHQWDDGSGEIRPWRCTTFIENDQCSITNNVLNGAQIKWTQPSEMNLFQANKWCKIDNNLMHDYNVQTSHDTIQQTNVINAGENQYVSFNNVDQMPDDMTTSQAHYLEVTCIINDGTPNYENTYVYRIPFVLMNKPVGDNTGFVQGAPVKVIGKDETVVVEIQYMDYYKFSNSIGVTFRNPTGSNNKYCFRIY